MHTLRPNDRRRFTHFTHLGRPPCRLGNSQPAKNASPPFYKLLSPAENHFAGLDISPQKRMLRRCFTSAQLFFSLRRYNPLRRFMYFPHLGRPPCRSGNSHPAKNASPPFYVRSAVFLTPSIKPAPPFYAFFASKNYPKKEKRRGISATDTSLSPTPRSLQCGLYPTRLDSTRNLPQSQRLFTSFFAFDKVH